MGSGCNHRCADLSTSLEPETRRANRFSLTANARYSGLDMMLLFDLIDEGHGWGMLQSDMSDKLCVATVRSRIQQQRAVG